MGIWVCEVYPSMIADDFLFVVFTVNVTVVLWYWEYDRVVLVMLSARG